MANLPDNRSPCARIDRPHEVQGEATQVGSISIIGSGIPSVFVSQYCHVRRCCCENSREPTWQKLIKSLADLRIGVGVLPCHRHVHFKVEFVPHYVRLVVWTTLVSFLLLAEMLQQQSKIFWRSFSVLHSKKGALCFAAQLQSVLEISIPSRADHVIGCEAIAVCS